MNDLQKKHRAAAYNRLEEIRNELEELARNFARNESATASDEPPSPVSGHLQRAIVNVWDALGELGS